MHVTHIDEALIILFVVSIYWAVIITVIWIEMAEREDKKKGGTADNLNCAKSILHHRNSVPCSCARGVFLRKFL